jgi:pimeloyl-ACP methyl ester carboxylesterase
VAIHSAGYLTAPVPLYYEQFGPEGTDHPVIVLVHGGAFSGSCYLATPDGRPGWAHDFVRHGYRVVVPDWPGVGRSSAVPPDHVTGEVVAQALGALLEQLAQPVILLVHSMAGPLGFHVVESHGALVRALVAVAPGPPGNIQPIPEVLREDDTEVEVALPSVNLRVAKTGSWRPTREFAIQKLLGKTTRFAPDDLPALMAATVPVPVPLLLARANLRGSQLVIERADHFARMPTLVLTGSHDADHPREADQATAEWLRSMGADVDYHFLPDHGVTGNGHMLMCEDNSDAIADHIAHWLADRTIY